MILSHHVNVVSGVCAIFEMCVYLLLNVWEFVLKGKFSFILMIFFWLGFCFFAHSRAFAGFVKKYIINFMHFAVDAQL